MQHGAGQRGGLARLHAAAPDRHQERRHLVVRDAARGVALDRERDLALVQGAAALLALDDLDDVHGSSPFRGLRRG